MKTYLLTSLMVLASFFMGYFFALDHNSRGDQVKTLQKITSASGQTTAATPLADCEQLKNGVTQQNLQKLLSQKEAQLDVQQKQLSAMATASNRYQVMMSSLKQRGYFRGPRIMENFEVNDMFVKFFQLSPEEELAIQEISSNALLNIQDWEIINAYLLNKGDKKIVYEIPAAIEEMNTVKNKFIDDLVTVIGEDNRELASAFLGDLFEQFSFRRIITMNSVKAQDPAYTSPRFKLRVKMFDQNGRRRRSASNSSGQIPKRFSHLFHEYSFVHE